MNKSTKVLLIVIGLLSILAGIFSYFSKSESSNAYFGMFIGIALIGTVLFTKSNK